MASKISSNFSEFLQTSSAACLANEKKEILEILKSEVSGILKQLKMIAQSNNSTIEFDIVSESFYDILNNLPVDMLTKNIYDLYYQELYCKIIRDGDYSLRSNRYEASNERTQILEKTLSNYQKNKDTLRIDSQINDHIRKFIEISLINGLLSRMEDEFLEIPCKQNNKALSEGTLLLNRTKDLIIARVYDACSDSANSLNSEIESYLKNKIRFEKGYTETNLNALSLSKLLEVRETFKGGSVSKKKRKKETVN